MAEAFIERRVSSSGFSELLGHARRRRARGQWGSSGNMPTDYVPGTFYVRHIPCPGVYKDKNRGWGGTEQPPRCLLLSRARSSAQ